jgi:hypothetical protein
MLIRYATPSRRMLAAQVTQDIAPCGCDSGLGEHLGASLNVYNSLPAMVGERALTLGTRHSTNPKSTPQGPRLSAGDEHPASSRSFFYGGRHYQIPMRRSNRRGPRQHLFPPARSTGPNHNLWLDSPVGPLSHRRRSRPCAALGPGQRKLIHASASLRCIKFQISG